MKGADDENDLRSLCSMFTHSPIGTWGRVHGNLQQNLTLIGWFKLYSNYSISLVGKRQKMKEGWK